VGSVISYIVAHYFLSHGMPTLDVLDRIVAGPAISMRHIRTLMNNSPPDVFDRIELTDMLIFLNRLRTSTSGRKSFRITFLDLSVEYSMESQVYFACMGKDEDLAQLQEHIRVQLSSCQRCAILVLFKQHTITGCFDKKV
jgi:hypothetical protein